MDATIERFVAELVDTTQRALGDDLVGVYLVGSLATGDARPGVSDVDVLVAATTISTDQRGELGPQIVTLGLRCPWAGVEYVVYRTADLGAPTYPIPYQLNVNAGPQREVSQSSAGEPPHWFFLDVAMARSHAISLLGPPADHTIGATSDSDVLAALHDALAWHLAEEPTSVNTVLNACRSWHWVVTRRWTSKTAGARWVVAEGLDTGLVPMAIAQRDRGDPAPLDAAAVHDVLTRVSAAVDDARNPSARR